MGSIESMNAGRSRELCLSNILLYPECPAFLISRFLLFLSKGELEQICQQFESTCRPNNQVLWSGVLREHAQRWADQHKMETLTTAMGPLMDLKNPTCRRSSKNDKEWSYYVKGASAVFAWYISTGERVTMLSPPPPERFHPSGLTNFQLIEAPILKRHGAKLQIYIVHPFKTDTSEYCYQLWPIDHVAIWTARYSTVTAPKHCWRQVSSKPHMYCSLNIEEDIKSEVSAIDILSGAQVITELHVDVKEVLESVTNSCQPVANNGGLEVKRTIRRSKRLEEQRMKGIKEVTTLSGLATNEDEKTCEKTECMKQSKQVKRQPEVEKAKGQSSKSVESKGKGEKMCPSEKVKILETRLSRLTGMETNVGYAKKVNKIRNKLARLRGVISCTNEEGGKAGENSSQAITQAEPDVLTPLLHDSTDHTSKSNTEARLWQDLEMNKISPHSIRADILWQFLTTAFLFISLMEFVVIMYIIQRL